MESFYKKNDLGVSIEYSIVSYYEEEENKYVIYTDFVESDSDMGVRLFVSKVTDDSLVDIPKEEEDRIIQLFLNTIKEKISLVIL